MSVVVEDKKLDEIVIVGKDGIEYRYPLQFDAKRKCNDDLPEMESNIKKCKLFDVNMECK